MAINKKDHFSKAENELASFSKALAHPARVAILKEIARRGGDCICGEIVDVMPLAQATVSQHLKELLKAGLITGTVDGARSCYAMNKNAFVRFERAFRILYEKSLSSDCCNL